MNSQSARQGRTATGATGWWNRRGRTIVVALPPSPGEIQEEISEEIGSPKQVIDPRIDVHAQKSLLRLSKNRRTSGDAAALLSAVKSGKLGGIYKEDQKVPALLAKALGRGWWEVLPKHADAALVQDRKKSAAPILVFRSSLLQNPSRLDKALERGWGLLQASTKLSPVTSVSGEILETLRKGLRSVLGAFPSPILPITGLLPSGRALDPAEKTLAATVFGKSLDFSRILVSDALGFGGRPFTLALGPFTVLNLGSGPFRKPASDRALLIHELTHSWQSQHHLSPYAYEVNSIASQAVASITGEDAYCYRPGKPFSSYAAEQIATSVENGFRGIGGSHEAAITAHIASVPAGRVDGQNTLSLMVPRTEKRGATGIVC